MCGRLVRRAVAACFVAALTATAAPAQPAAPVETVEAVRSAVGRTVRLSGTVEARRRAVVASEVAAVVAEVAVREGATVRRGEVLVRLRADPIELELRAARADVEEARARLASAELRLERMNELGTSAVISRQQVDDARYEAEAMAGRVKRLEVEVARLERDLEQAAVRAPFAGVVTRQDVEVGEWVATGDAVVEMLSLEDLEVRLEVPERHFGEIALGAPARVRLGAQGRSLVGSVRAIIPAADPRARTFPVLVALDASPAVGAGLLANVELPVGGESAAVLVPKDALLTVGDEQALFVVEGGVARRRGVRPGSAAGDWVAIAEGVAAGETVVVRGNERLTDGQAVRALPVDLAPPPEAGITSDVGDGAS